MMGGINMKIQREEGVLKGLLNEKNNLMEEYDRLNNLLNQRESTGPEK